MPQSSVAGRVSHRGGGGGGGGEGAASLAQKVQSMSLSGPPRREGECNNILNILIDSEFPCKTEHNFKNWLTVI